MTETLLPLVIVIPLAGGGLALLGKAAPAVSRMTSILAVASIAGAGVLLGILAPEVFGGGEIRYALGNWPEPYGIAIVMDGFAWLSASLTVLIAIPVGVASLSKRRYDSPFFFFLLLLVAGMLSVALTGDLFTMFVSFEIIAISAYVLIAYDRNPAGLLASLKYLFLSSVGILFFLFGVFLVYRDVGALSIRVIGIRLAASPVLADTPSMHLAVAALCVGIGVRTAFVPFHTWLPEAHAYAPHPVSALLSGALIKVSLFGMIRVIRMFDAVYLNELLLWIGGATALGAVVIALAQSDAKRLLAFHSVSQMGYVLAAFAATTGISVAASLTHAVSHALFKSLLFLSVGAAVELTGERDLFRMRTRRVPVLALLFLVGAMSISAIPPFNGYMSKALVMESVSGSPVRFLLLATGAATIASFIKLSRIFVPAGIRAGGSPGAAASATNGATDRGDLSSSTPGVLLIIAAAILAALCVVMGLFGREFAVFIHRLAGSGEIPYIPPMYSVEKIVTTLVSLVAGVGVYLLVVSPPGKRVAGRLKEYSPDLRVVLLFFLIGLLGFGLVAYL